MKGAERQRSDLSARVLSVTVLTVPVADAELGADRLMLAGAFAVEERAAANGGVELRAALGDGVDATLARLGALPATWAIHVEQVDPTPLDTWREFARPIRVGHDLVLRPAWLPELAEQGVVEIAIEPGAAFGLGDHPTTRLSAAAVWRRVRPGDRVLDVGCGTGALAIVALKAGAAHATAIDIATAAAAATGDNARRNGVAGRLDVSTSALADVDGTFDVVVANILAPTLISLAPDLRRVTAIGGTLIVSGVLAGRHEHVLAALAPLRAVRTDELDGWAAVELVHD